VVGVGSSGRRENVGKGYRMVNIVQILRMHVCKWKNETCENSKNEVRGMDEGEWWRG
jgi:hypothetical protein